MQRAPKCSKKQKAEERKSQEELHKKEKMESKKWEEKPFKERKCTRFFARSAFSHTSCKNPVFGTHAKNCFSHTRLEKPSFLAEKISIILTSRARVFYFSDLGQAAIYMHLRHMHFPVYRWSDDLKAL